MSAEKESNNGHHAERVATAMSARSSENDVADTKDVGGDDAVAQWVEDTAAEKRLVRKLDWRILPCTWILYLLGFLDRANIGYARPIRHILGSLLVMLTK